jgi:hypothetical protein
MKGRWMTALAGLLLGAVSAASLAADLAVPLSGVKVEPLVIDAEMMAGLPRQSVEVSDHGTPARFEGVWLRDVLVRAGAPLGKAMRGRNTALVVVITARDGYTTTFSLVELDDTFRDKPVLLADRRDGEPLFEETGPLQVVAADESRAGRWIRQVAKIEVVDPVAD